MDCVVTTRQQGFTLVELMVVVAIIAVIAAIALPAYNGYIRESRLGVARINADSIRLFLEDFQLDNGTYICTAAIKPACTFSSPYNTSQLNTAFGWTPDGDGGSYAYSVDVTTNSYDILIRHPGSGDWLRCDNRMSKCCDGKGAGGTSACP